MVEEEVKVVNLHLIVVLVLLVLQNGSYCDDGYYLSTTSSLQCSNALLLIVYAVLFNLTTIGTCSDYYSSKGSCCVVNASKRCC